MFSVDDINGHHIHWSIISEKKEEKKSGCQVRVDLLTIIIFSFNLDFHKDPQPISPASPPPTPPSPTLNTLPYSFFWLYITSPRWRMDPSPKLPTRGGSLDSNGPSDSCAVRLVKCLIHRGEIAYLYGRWHTARQWSSPPKLRVVASSVGAAFRSDPVSGAPGARSGEERDGATSCFSRSGFLKSDAPHGYLRAHGKIPVWRYLTRA